MLGKDPLQLAREALDRAIDTEKRNKAFVSAIGPAIVQVLEPFLKGVRTEIKDAFSNVRVDVQPRIEVNPEVRIPEIRVPDVIVPEIKVPEAKVTVNVPPIKVPDIVMPEEMEVKGWVGLMGYDKSFREHPLPVQLMDGKGNPVDFSGGSNQIISSGGGKADFFTIKGYSDSAFSQLQNPDGRLKVELPTGSSGLTDTELRASSVPVMQVSGAVDSVSVVSTVGLTDTELRATAVPVSGTFFQATQPISGTVAVSGVTDSVQATIIDSSGVGYSGSNPFPTTIVTNATATVNAVLVDSAGAYRGTLPVAVVAGSAAIGSVTVNGSLNSVIAVGATLHGVADPGAAPQKVGGVVMTANPTAEVGGDVSNFRTDDIGRQLIRPLQVRDLIQTAYVSVTTGTETTLRAAVAGAFLDLIMIVGSNNSDAAVSVDIRPVTAGNIINTLRIPANGTAGWTPPVPWPQSEQGNNWTVDGPDETGRTLTFSALFSQEV